MNRRGVLQPIGVVREQHGENLRRIVNERRQRVLLNQPFQHRLRSNEKPKSTLFSMTVVPITRSTLLLKAKQHQNE